MSGRHWIQILTEQKKIKKEDGFISITAQIMLERLIISIVGRNLYIEDPYSDEYFQSMILKYFGLIHSYPNTDSREILVTEIMDLEKARHQ